LDGHALGDSAAWRIETQHRYLWRHSALAAWHINQARCCASSRNGMKERIGTQTRVRLAQWQRRRRRHGMAAATFRSVGIAVPWDLDRITWCSGISVDDDGMVGDGVSNSVDLP